MRSLLVAAILALAVSPALAGPNEDVRDLYDRFYHAQNARDLDRVRPLLSVAPPVIWVSDGKTFKGADAILERMGSFQRAEVWESVPDLDQAEVVQLSDASAYMHLRLVLRIGSARQPDEIPFLVTMLAIDTEAGWRIAGLLTTVAKP